MHATTVAIDLAKDVFELAFADAEHRIVERKRLTRRAVAHVLDNRGPLRVVMEACGSAHYWARRFARQGHTVCLLPARDVRPYVRRNKTDRTDVAGILEADRCAQIDPVPIKSPDQQGIQALHRIRERLKVQRTSTINLLRGVLREFGLVIPLGASKVRPTVLAILEDGDNDLPMALRHTLGELLDRLRLMRQCGIARPVPQRTPFRRLAGTDPTRALLRCTASPWRDQQAWRWLPAGATDPWGACRAACGTRATA
jgi:transposase